uniref:C2H2-type domain-containing protein n=1 Tax=Meloidogyne incognita TaxID=6306 RepID=A0A914N2X1_MELIC
MKINTWINANIYFIRPAFKDGLEAELLISTIMKNMEDQFTCPICRRGILHDPEPLQVNERNEHNGIRNQNLPGQTENNNQLSLINLVSNLKQK